MIERLRITILADNYAAAPNLLAEHGLSMLIEADGRRILFDTGQGRVLPENARALGVDLAGLDAVVLSHGHFDHTGGLAALLRESPPAAVFLHPAAAEPKYAKLEGLPERAIGMPEPSLAALRAVGGRIVWTRSATAVVPGVWATGEIPRRSAPSAEGLFADAECRTPDPVPDDQALFVETPNGVVVIAGCAHAGVVNTLDHVCDLTGRRELFALAGGLHLFRSAQEQVEACAAAIKARRIRILAPCHCTGLGAHSYLRARFDPLVQDVGAGATLVIRAAKEGTHAG